MYSYNLLQFSQTYQGADINSVWSGNNSCRLCHLPALNKYWLCIGTIDIPWVCENHLQYLIEPVEVSLRGEFLYRFLKCLFVKQGCWCFITMCLICGLVKNCIQRNITLWQDRLIRISMSCLVGLSVKLKTEVIFIVNIIIESGVNRNNWHFSSRLYPPYLQRNRLP